MDEKEKLAYDVVLQIVIDRGHAFWTGFQTMSTVNGLIASLAGAALSFSDHTTRVGDLLCWFGLVVSTCWYAISRRQVRYYDHYNEVRRRLEKKVLPDFQKDPLSPKVKTSTMLHLIIACFGILYICFLVI